MLFNEPKLLKCRPELEQGATTLARFSALQRAEIAEIKQRDVSATWRNGFSALQRAEIAEILSSTGRVGHLTRLFQCSSTSRNC